MRRCTVTLMALPIRRCAGTRRHSARGAIQKIDVDKMVLTLKVADKEREFVLTRIDKFWTQACTDLKERLKGFKPGANVLFKAVSRDGKEYLIGSEACRGGGAPVRRRIPRSWCR